MRLKPSSANCQKPTAYCPLPSAFCLLLTASCLLPTPPRFPIVEDCVDLVTHLGAGSGAVGGSHQDFIVVRVPVADGGDDGSANR